MERPKSRELALNFSDDQERRRIGRDPLDPLSRLLRARRVFELAEQPRERDGVPGSRFAELRL